VVIDGKKNPYYRAVAKDIVDAILKARSGKGVSAIYWKKEEQEVNLIAVYEKWLKKGGVWSAAANKVSRQ
jgi:hypothetical protein